MTERKPTADITMYPHGILVGFVGFTKFGKRWMRDNIKSEPGQWMGNHLCVEPRCAVGLFDAMYKSGLEVTVA